MNQVDLIAHVADAAGLSKADAGKAVEAVLGAVSNELTAGKEVRLHGFGIFSTANRAAREGRNPQTEATVQIAASKAAKFSPAKALKDRLNAAS
jgi:DNA-binding protein HU-beta